MNPNTLALSPGSLEVAIDAFLSDRHDVQGRSLRFGVLRKGKLYMSSLNFRDLNQDVETVGNEDWHIVTVADAVTPAEMWGPQ